MSAIAIQSALGNIGEKPVTYFNDFEFNSLVSINGFSLGANNKGLFLLNVGDKDEQENFEKTFTLATSDFNINNFKRFRYIYIGIKTDNDFILSVAVDENDWHDYVCNIKKTGLQRIRIPISRIDQGRYWKIKIVSDDWFRIDHIQGLMTIRSFGVQGN